MTDQINNMTSAMYTLIHKGIVIVQKDGSLSYREEDSKKFELAILGFLDEDSLRRKIASLKKEISKYESILNT